MKKSTPASARTDLLPVIVGGDISVYALGRQFHEAFGVRSVALGTGVIAAIEHSGIFDVRLVPDFAPKTLLAEVTRIADELAERRPGATVVLLANTDATIEDIISVRDELPDNVVCPVPDQGAFDLVSDKVSFARLCERHGLPTPATQIVSLAGEKDVPPTGLEFPVVAKPACSAEYFPLLGRGFRKVYLMESQEALDRLWAALREEGFTGDFLVQECIRGDDTHMGAITLYFGRDGEALLSGCAQTLLEDHAPSLKGNAVAMVTRDFPELVEKSVELLRSVGYRGFAEVDIKLDPRTGEWLFFEVNPRIGRNSYYLVAGGVNPMRVMVADLVDRQRVVPARATRRALYTLVPWALLRRYLSGRLLDEVSALVSAGSVFDPQRYAADMGIRRRVDVELTEMNHFRKFRRYYPKVSNTSF